jgi:hypothetical protein
MRIVEKKDDFQKLVEFRMHETKRHLRETEALERTLDDFGI